jgi:hypothetical protein
MAGVARPLTLVPTEKSIRVERDTQMNTLLAAVHGGWS